MTTYNWHSFNLRININASVAAVYEMWSTAQAIEKWFLRQCEIKSSEGVIKAPGDVILKGDTYLWRWHGYPDDTMEQGEILDANGMDLFQFTFGQEGADTMVCTVKIYTEAEETICELIQGNIPDNDKGKTFYHIGCFGGWTFYLANLKSILEGGVDLRNKNEALKKMLNS